MAAREKRTIFIRQSFIERGHIPNTWSFRRVQKIEVLPSGLSLLVKHFFKLAKQHHHIAWQDVRRVEVVEKDTWKSIGNTAFAYKRRICMIKSPLETFEIDVSEAYGDFRETRHFLNALKEHVEVIEPPKQKRSRK